MEASQNKLIFLGVRTNKMNCKGVITQKIEFRVQNQVIKLETFKDSYHPKRTSLVAKASAYNKGDLGSTPGLGRSPGERNDNPLQYSCLENPTDGGAWWATVHGVTKSRNTTK